MLKCLTSKDFQQNLTRTYSNIKCMDRQPFYFRPRMYFVVLSDIDLITIFAYEKSVKESNISDLKGAGLVIHGEIEFPA